MSVPVVPPWLAVALGEIGTLEAPGDADNPRVVEYHSATAAGAAPDGVAWCSSFMNWCMLQCGIIGTRNKSARSWLKWSGGEVLKEPRLGCIMVCWREDPHAATGHVGLYLGHNKRGYYILGGNQSNEVNVRLEPTRRVLGFVWPKDREEPIA